MDHPFVSQLLADPGADYFAVRKFSEEWTLGGHSALMTFWHRPLHVIKAVTNGLRHPRLRHHLLATPEDLVLTSVIDAGRQPARQDRR